MRAGNDLATTTSDREIVISRVFDAPRTLVFKAWTDPKQVARWWGPKGFTGAVHEMDVRPGGLFHLQLLGPDGAIYPCQGIYREIVEPERIVFVGPSEDSPACGAGLPPRALVTVTFAEHEGKTTVTIHTRFESAADREAAVKAGFNPGWTSCLERLGEYLVQT